MARRFSNLKKTESPWKVPLPVAHNPLDAGDFDISFDEQTGELCVNKCPNGQAPIEQNRSEKTGRILVHFDVSVCRACPEVIFPMRRQSG